MNRRLAPLCLAVACAAALAAPAATAQATAEAASQPTANTSYAYAQVLRVEPVYERRTVQAVDPDCLRPDNPPAPTRPAAANCKPHPVAVRSIVAYDVEYNYKGDTYMSRLPYDPGSRLRVQVSVTPVDDRPSPSVAPPETR